MLSSNRLDAKPDSGRLAQTLLHDGWLLAPRALFHFKHRPTGSRHIEFSNLQSLRALELARNGMA